MFSNDASEPPVAAGDRHGQPEIGLHHQAQGNGSALHDTKEKVENGLLPEQEVSGSYEPRQ